MHTNHENSLSLQPPFGMQIEERAYTNGDKGYRFGFNGKEKDDEGMGGGGSTYDYGFRIYNAQLGKFLSVDPLSSSYPWYTPYQFAGNKVVIAIDLDGLEEFIVIITINNQEPLIKDVTVYKIELTSRKASTTNTNPDIGTGGVEYRITDAEGKVTITREQDFIPGSTEQLHLDEKITYYSDYEATKELQGSRRDAMIERPLDANGNVMEVPPKEGYFSKYISKGNVLTKSKLMSADIPILFHTDKTEFTSKEVANYEEAKKNINSIAKHLNSKPYLRDKYKIIITGTYDSRTSAYNKGCGNPCLANDRAKNVKKYLDVQTNNTFESNSLGVENTKTEVKDEDRNAKISIVPK